MEQLRPNGDNDLKNSESESQSKEKEQESTSEEYKNFENFTKAILSIPPNEAKEITKRTPKKGDN